VADQRERLVLLTPRSHCAVGATGSSGARPGRASTLESAPISLTNKRAVSSARSFPLCTQWPTRTPAARARAATRCTAARPAPRERPLGVLGVNRRLAALHQVQVHDGHLRCLLHHPAQPAIHRTHREAEVLGVPGTSLQTRRAEGGMRGRPTGYVPLVKEGGGSQDSSARRRLAWRGVSVVLAVSTGVLRMLCRTDRCMAAGTRRRHERLCTTAPRPPLRRRLHRWRLEPLYICNEVGDSLVALVQVVDRALVDDLPHRVAARWQRLSPREDVSEHPSN